MRNIKLYHPAKFQIKRIKIVREFFPGHFWCFFFLKSAKCKCCYRFQTLNMYTIDPSLSYYNIYRDFDRILLNNNVTWKTFFGYSIQ